MGTVVVGVDGSDASRQALRWALAQARLTGDRVRAVHVKEFHPPAIVTRSGAEVFADDDELAAARAALAELVQEVVGDDRGVDIEQEVVVDRRAAHALVERSKDADLMVVGSRGHGGFVGLLLGSVSQQLVSHAACPVVVWPHARRGNTM